jgi:hypothetical protein
MEYQLIPIVSDRDCLFRFVSYLTFGTQKHRNTQFTVVNLVINNWDTYKKFVISDFSYRLPIYAVKPR